MQILNQSSPCKSVVFSGIFILLKVFLFIYITTAEWAICLGPTGNMQGSYKFMSLTTGKKIVRRKFTEMPITESVIRQVDKWGQKDRAQNGLTFLNSGTLIVINIRSI